MFEGLQKNLTAALRRLTGAGRLTEANMKEGLETVRQALLEADVNYNVATAFVQRVSETAAGQEILKSLQPGQQIVKIVYDELVQLMGPVEHGFHWAKERPTTIMLCGLQGSGKTTTAGKLALTLRERGRRPLLVAADLQRPAAVDQLKVIGDQLSIPVYSETGSTPLKVCLNAVIHAKKTALDTIILDTAGRLHVDEMPMEELKDIDRQVKPDDVLLVCDAMTGQDAVNSSKAFNEALELNGVILTKLDGDARGGAALSIKEVTQVPIKYIGVGEKLDRLEEFHPDRMAQRILGQGDLMSLVEHVVRVQSQVDQEKLAEQQRRLAKGDFSLEQFRDSFGQMKELGIKKVMSMMPGMDMSAFEELGDDPEEAFVRMQGMIDSMTKEERSNPDVIDLSRRRRIAAGSGNEPHEVKKFLEQFDVMRSMMRQFANMSMWERMKMLTGLSKAGAFMPGSKMLQKTKIGTGHRKTAKERAEERKKKRKKGRR